VLIDINPVFISIGGLAVGWCGVLALVGLGLAIWLSLRELDRQPTDRVLALNALAWALPAGVLIARLVYVIGYWGYFLPSANEFWQLNLGGLSLWGGLVGGGLVAAARLKHEAVSRRRIFDIVVPYVALGVAVGRLGEFLDGQGQGVASALPWATQYGNHLAATPDFGIARHPAPVYDGVVALGVFALLKVLPTALPAGTRLAAFLVVYGLGRIIFGHVRLDPAFLFGLQLEQFLALGCVVFGAAYGLRHGLWSSVLPRLRFNGKAAQQALAKEDRLAA